MSGSTRMKREIGERAIITAAEDQTYCDLEGEAVILKFATGAYHGLNEVGARAWSLIQRPTAFAEVLRQIVAEYDVEPQECACDLRALFGEMESAGLVQIEDEEKQ